MRKTYPKRYTKHEFIKYLEKHKVGENIATDFKSLPEEIVRSGDTFRLDINSTWYPENETHYDFEMNYYSEDTVEYLFNSKIFTNIISSINYLLCELINNNYIKDGECD